VSQCVFCDIVRGKKEASRVYEDQVTLAFMDLHQLNEGHVLIIPNQHFETIDEVPLDIVGALFKTAVVVARAVQQVFMPDGLNIWQSSGAAAGQEVPHVHLHVFPRKLTDGFGAFAYPIPPQNTERPRLDELALQIRRKIGLYPHSSRSEE
jgi:histidine triad (HIT) family protein